MGSAAQRASNWSGPHCKSILIIPKGAYISWDDFSTKATAQEITGFVRAIGLVGQQINAVQGGYRLLSNHGKNANQEVPHLHVHLVGGEPLGPMICKQK
ncbi:MAG: HIT domain-containing protein [Pseudomonadota bacterium]